MVAILADESIEAVMHFAAFCSPSESLEKPLLYYENNVVATVRLLGAMLERGVHRFVFSSTCSTYGEPETMPITEDAPQRPINVYGQTKLDVENVLRSLAGANSLASASFRYFQRLGGGRRRQHRRAPRSRNTPDSPRDCGRLQKGPGALHLRQRLRHARRHVSARLHARRRP